MLCHLNAAYNLARWLTGSDADAEDVVQDAALRAHRFFDHTPVHDARAWFLQIVRHRAHTFLARESRFAPLEDGPELADPSPGPQTQLESAVSAMELEAALESLPVKFREVLVLRELEALSYRELATILAIPEGTVMSRLSRAREALRHTLTRTRERSSS